MEGAAGLRGAQPQRGAGRGGAGRVEEGGVCRVAKQKKSKRERIEEGERKGERARENPTLSQRLFFFFAAAAHRTSPLSLFYPRCPSNPPLSTQNDRLLLRDHRTLGQLQGLHRRRVARVDLGEDRGDLKPDIAGDGIYRAG